MILGMGSDITDIRRIEKSLARLEKRVFTEGERKTAQGRKKLGKKIVAATYAKRFAAKEACFKALDAKTGVSWRDMEVVNLPGGGPTLRLTGGALAKLKKLTPKGMRAVIHLSLSDEYPYALAQVIISAEPL